MGGIAAILRFDGAPEDPAALHAMVAAMDYRARGGAAIHCDAGAAIAHCRMHPAQTPADAQVQPLIHPESGLALVFDGYLANREDLRADLLAKGVPLQGRPDAHDSADDAELVLHAFLTWGARCAILLEGEFAALVWDQHKREAHALRDHHGLRPLYYAHHGHSLILASEITAVLAALPDQPPLNRGYLAEVALDLSFTAEETLWQGVQRLPAAHRLHAHPGGLTLHEYWHLDTAITLPIRSDADYIEAYREMFLQAVRQSARSPAPVACEVSGGLDSSAVFAAAHHLAAHNSLPAPGLHGFTLAGPPGTLADEVAYARAVGCHVGREIHESPLFMPPLGWFQERANRDRDAPPWPNAAMSTGLEQAAANAGCQVLLSGVGGDQWLDGTTFHYQELLQAREWRRLAAQLAADRADRGWGETAALFLRRALASRLPPAMRQFRRQLWPRDADDQARETALLLPEVRNLLAQREAAYEARFAPDYQSSYKLRKLKHARWSRVLDQASRQRAQNGLEMRSPMLARRFITFCAATPEHLHLRGRQGKYLHRKAMAGMLPEIVLTRQSKAEFSTPYFHHDAALQEACTGPLAEVLCRMFRDGAVEQMFEHYLSAPIDERYTGAVWGAYSCGLLMQLAGPDFGKGNQ